MCFLGSVLLIGGPVHAQTVVTVPEQLRPNTVLLPHEQSVWVRARELDVNTAERRLSVETVDGVVELQVDDTVKRLDDVYVNDLLDVRYEHALALKVLPASPGIRERTTAYSSVRAGADSNPVGSGYIAETITADVVQIDRVTGLFRIRGAKGKFAWIRLPDARMAETIRLGDQLEIRYRLAVAIEFKLASEKP